MGWPRIPLPLLTDPPTGPALLMVANGAPRIYLVPEAPVRQLAALETALRELGAPDGPLLGISLVHDQGLDVADLDPLVDAGLAVVEWTVPGILPEDADRLTGRAGVLDAMEAWLATLRRRNVGRLDARGGRTYGALRIEVRLPLDTRAVDRPDQVIRRFDSLAQSVDAILLEPWARRRRDGTRVLPDPSRLASLLANLLDRHAAIPVDRDRAEVRVTGPAPLLATLLEARPDLCDAVEADDRTGPQGSSGLPTGDVQAVAAAHRSPLARFRASLWDVPLRGTPNAGRVDVAAGDLPTTLAVGASDRALLVRLPATLPQAALGMSAFPPLSLVRLASTLHQGGVPVTVRDLGAEARRAGLLDVATPATPEALLAWCLPRLREALGATTPSLVGFSAESDDASALAGRLAAHVPDAALRVVGGRGVHGGRRLLETWPGLDLVVEGEGELALAAIWSRRQRGQTYAGIPGVCARQAGRAVTVTSADHALDAFATPFVEWVDPALYGESPFPFDGRPALPWMFVHGCPFGCAFCGDWTAGRMRLRDPARVVADLRSMTEQTGLRDFYFLNTLINGDPAHMEAFLSHLLAARLDLRWADSAKPRHLDRSTMQRLRQAGCVSLTWGIDAAARRVNLAMRKGYDLDEASDILRWTHEAGIANIVNLIAGLPGETDADLDETCTWLARHAPYLQFVHVMPFLFLPNSPMHRDPGRFGLRPRPDGGFDEVGGPAWPEKQARIIASRDRMRQTVVDLGLRL